MTFRIVPFKSYHAIVVHWPTLVNGKLTTYYRAPKQNQSIQ